MWFRGPFLNSWLAKREEATGESYERRAAERYGRGDPDWASSYGDCTSSGDGDGEGDADVDGDAGSDG